MREYAVQRESIVNGAAYREWKRKTETLASGINATASATPRQTGRRQHERWVRCEKASVLSRAGAELTTYATTQTPNSQHNASYHQHNTTVCHIKIVVNNASSTHQVRLTKLKTTHVVTTPRNTNVVAHKVHNANAQTQKRKREGNATHHKMVYVAALCSCQQ